MPSVIILGAGLAGLVLARELESQFDVVLFDKARGVGGRMATRRAGDFRFDHGAQFFTARSRKFRDYLAPLIDEGVVAPWHARFVEHTRASITARRDWATDYPHYVGVPAMNALPKRLAEGLDIRLQTRIVDADRVGDGWLLTDEHGGTHESDWLLVTTPGPQAKALLGERMPGEVRTAAESMRACYALMFGFDEPQVTEFDATRVLDADISWISVNSSKPGRDPNYTIVVHATNAWADANADIELAEAMAHLASEFEAVSGLRTDDAVHSDIHRWRYANTGRQDGEGFYFDRQSQLGICGDWLLRGRVEAAFQSALRLADRLGDDLA